MKKYSSSLSFILFLLFLVPVSVIAQEKDSIKAAGIRSMIAEQHYIFKAQSATPMSGRLRQLNTDYDLKVSKEHIVAYLPYFGRSYSAPIDPSRGGIQFDSKKFDYKLTERKKGGWNVSIQTKDVQESQQLQLTIFTDGTASLQVNSNNRQSISFNGYITDAGKAK